MLTRASAALAALRGAQAEARAEVHLRRQGLRSIARNWRCPLGELDLVMAEHNTLVVVEVKARSHRSHGGALASVDLGKRRRLVRATQVFLERHPVWQTAPIRFDVVCFDADEGLLWLQGAFTTDDLA